MRHLNGVKFGSAPGQFRAKTATVGVCSTFAFATETTIEELKNCSKNENTAKSTGRKLKAGCTLLEHFHAEVNNNKTLWSVHFGVVVVEMINCKCGGIVRNEIW